MLTSTKRRLLHILSVSMAIASVAYGLVLKYGNTSETQDLAVKSQFEEQRKATTEIPTILSVSNPVTEPDN
ncbi:hypothetical protein [Roseivirga sp.]|uniref:hypothetical protein n=1 Tax=Roseivirga sp. TaxID=1964215 RepID=UPI003B8E375E